MVYTYHLIKSLQHLKKCNVLHFTVMETEAQSHQQNSDRAGTNRALLDSRVCAYTLKYQVPPPSREVCDGQGGGICRVTKETSQPTRDLGALNWGPDHGATEGGRLASPASDTSQSSPAPPEEPPWDHMAQGKEQSINHMSCSIRQTKMKSWFLYFPAM